MSGLRPDGVRVDRERRLGGRRKPHKMPESVQRRAVLLGGPGIPPDARGGSLPDASVRLADQALLLRDWSAAGSGHLCSRSELEAASGAYGVADSRELA